MSRAVFTAIRTEGGLLPGDLLQRIDAGDKRLPGLKSDRYGLLPHEPLGEAINRSWSRLVGAWRFFQDAKEKLPENDRGTTLTRERWLMPLFQELGYGRLQVAKAIVSDGRDFAISHTWEGRPIHLVSFRYDLDKRIPGVKGAAESSPHGLLQDLLNHSDTHLWGLVSNGTTLRLLRDHHSLTRKAYVEFDLEQIFAGDLYSEFRLLWLTCHATRLEGEKHENYLLEQWFQAAREEGVQALDKLRGGVEDAIVSFGTGFLRHPANRELRAQLQSGALKDRDLYRQLLRLMYRLIFIFVAEDRDLLLNPDAPREARERYRDFYATRRLRNLADKRRGGPHGDLWAQLRMVLGLLYEGYEPLGLPAYGSFLWSPEATAALNGCELANEHLLAALKALCTLHEGGMRRPVAWSLVSADELGGIYESLMELHPVIHKESDRDSFRLETAPGHERKTTGSYYTPTSLVDCLLDSALDPVLEEAARKPNPEAAILELKVVDPACGSGHFLVAAARRIAERLARVRTGDAEPAPRDYQHALRDVVGRCIYGVDLNDMAVELCKVALWMEAIEPGRPLSFLDGHIQHGHALLGATPKLLADGVPDDAWKPLEGDDPAIARELRARNRRERQGQMDLLGSYAAEPEGKYSVLDEQLRKVEKPGDPDLAAVRAKESAWRALTSNPEWKDAWFAADLWCSAFVWPKIEGPAAYAPTHELYRRVRQDASRCSADTRKGVRRLAKQYRFFHWHLAFPAVFRKERGEASDAAGWEGGFDVVLGNPPWERIKLQEKEFFAARAPDVANAANAAARKKAIEQLEKGNPELWDSWKAALRQADGESVLVRDSGRYPLCGRGDINTYSIFAELNRTLIDPTGRTGFIVPSGIATDATTQHYFRSIVETRQLASLLSFENEDFVFPGVHHAYKFALVTLTGPKMPSSEADLLFFARRVEDLLDIERHFTLSARDFALINPNTLTCPTFRWRRDAEITKAIYGRVPVLWQEDKDEGNPWGVSFRAMFHMANDSGLFHTREELELEGYRLAGNVFKHIDQIMLPLYEAKMLHHFDHRFGTYEGQTGAQANQGKCPELTPEQHFDPYCSSLPKYWVNEEDVDTRLEGYWKPNWLLGWRKICRSVDQRTFIGTVFPKSGFGDSGNLAFVDEALIKDCGVLLAGFLSFVFDYVVRQKVGGANLNYFLIKQFPVLPPVTYSKPVPWCPAWGLSDWISSRIVELTYTSWDLQPFAQDQGYDGPPFRWEEERRFKLRAELDAAYFHLYGVAREDVAYIMDTFWVVRNNDERAHGTYRTKNAILTCYDAMQSAIDTGIAYQTILDPPPADPRVAHPPRGAAKPADYLWTLAELTRADTVSPPFRLDLGGKAARVLPWAEERPPQEGEMVLVRHGDVVQAGRKVGLATGKVRVGSFRDPQTNEPLQKLILTGLGQPAELSLPAAAWPAFRPLGRVQVEEG